MTVALVLFGAGASLGYGAPTTDALTNAIEQSINADDNMRRSGGDIAFKKIRDRLCSYLDHVNFEHIYHCVHELVFTFPPHPKVADEYKPVLLPFIERTTKELEQSLRSLDLPSLPPVFIERNPEILELTLRSLARKTIESIVAKVADICAKARPDLDPLARFIERLKIEHVTRVYTTNYDDFLIQADRDLYTGFNSAPSTKPKPFELDDFWLKQDLNSVLHLHGSVHLAFPDVPARFDELFWFDDLDEARKFSTFSGASSQEQRMDGGQSLISPVITGLEKLSHLQHRPMSHYYAAFARDAMRADVIYVIGSGLGDLHLNTWLNEARRRKPVPPILFIDLWEHGILHEMHFEELDPKLLKIRHGLGIDLSFEKPGEELNGWRITDDRTAAVWDKGFTRFLDAQENLKAVLSAVATKNRPTT